MSLATMPEVETEQVFALDREYVMGTYGRQPIVFVRGEGARLWDSEGREYLDFLSGISVCSVGHCHPRVSRAIAEQASTLMHVSNLYHHPLQSKLAQRLTGLTGMDKVFFSNSGAEANECAIKIARKWAKQHKGPDCNEIISFTGSFHGRTLATVTATAQPKYQDPFKPVPAGFKYVERGDLNALDEALTEKTCAIIIEPVQGESGIHVIPNGFLQAVRALCDESGILLILDEIQSGMGRTGRFLASQHSGVQGDIVTLAKAIANGIPMGACLAKGDAANTLVPGDHGSTFGGQLIACAAALATLDVLEDEDLKENAQYIGDYFQAGLRKLQSELPGKINEVRGLGLMVGLDMVQPEAKTVLGGLLERGIVANAIGENTLRFLPPLIVGEKECDRVIEALHDVLVGK